MSQGFHLAQDLSEAPRSLSSDPWHTAVLAFSAKKPTRRKTECLIASPRVTPKEKAFSPGPPFRPCFEQRSSAQYDLQLIVWPFSGYLPSLSVLDRHLFPLFKGYAEMVAGELPMERFSPDQFPTWVLIIMRAFPFGTLSGSHVGP